MKTKNSDIAHDLNNLFTGLIGNLSLLKDHPNLPPEVKERLLLLERSAQKAFLLTQQLIKVDSDRSGKPPPI